ncbi:MAG: sulfatase [Planctomycetes bacterium]|nr:sulfatase [Planctomycetota bacterium]
MFTRLAACAVAYSFVAAAAAAEPVKPNVVLYFVDDMGWVDSGAYGSTFYETPRIDAFAAQSVRFTNAYSCPLCSPTRATILSGQYAARHGTTTASGHQPPQPAGQSPMPAKAPANQPLLLPESRNYLEPAQYTLAELLHDAGYRTAHIGKWHLGATQPHWPETQGFDVAWHAHPDPGPPNYFSPYGVKTEGEPRGQTHVGTITDGPEGEYIVDRVADEAIRFIDANRERPFFLNVWQFGVHGPWGHKESVTAEYAKKKDPRGVQSNPIMASMLKSVDESFGRILDALDKAGLAENTIVIFMSDNGGNVHSNLPGDKKAASKTETPRTAQLKDWSKWAGDEPPTRNTPLRSGKGTLYEGGVRVPMMVRWPGQIAAAVRDDVVGAVDIYPTVAALTDMTPDPTQKLDGMNLAGVLKGGKPVDGRAYFNYFPHGGPTKPPGVTVRQGDWKLIRWYLTGPEYPELIELYDLKNDIGETTNVAAANPDRVRELSALIDGFLRGTNALVPMPNPDFVPGSGKPPVKKRAPMPTTTPTETVVAPINGWRARGCTAELRDGKLVVTGAGRQSAFLGIAGLKSTGAAVLTLETAAGSGVGKVQWRTAAQTEFPEEGQVVEFTIPDGGPRKTEVKLPVDGQLAHVRVYLPAQTQPVIVERIGLTATAGAPRDWDFGK